MKRTLFVRHALAIAVAATAFSSTNATGQALEEIIVTAQFTETNLQSTPIAITALTANELDARSFTNIADVAKIAPNVAFEKSASGYGNAVSAYIRGIGQYDFQTAFEPGVGMYIDDVYHGTLYGSSFDLLDLERVEILRGPQGTLFGKNSIGGAVRLITQKPAGTNTGYIEATFGESGRMDFRGSFDASLIDDVLYARVSALSKSRDGYVDRIDYACANPGQPSQFPSQKVAGGDCKLGTLGGEDVKAGRVALRWIASDKLEIDLAADWTKDNSETAADTLIYADGSLLDPAIQQSFIDNFGLPWDDRFIPRDKFATYSNFTNPFTGEQFDPHSTLDAWSVSAVVNYELADNMGLKGIIAYKTYEGDFTADSDGSPLVIQNVYNTVEQEQLSIELQLSGSHFNERLDWTTGIYYYESEDELGGHVVIYPVGSDFFNNDTNEVENLSLFGHAVWEFTDSLRGTIGLRYTDETKDYSLDHGPGNAAQVSADEKRVDWRVGLDYQISYSAMVYASAATGYRSASFNPRPFIASQVNSIPPEEVTAYELGLKTDWFDNRLRINSAIFFSDYETRTVSNIGPDPDFLPIFMPRINYSNDPAEIQGFELEVAAEPIAGLSITGAVGYAETDADTLNGGLSPYVPEWTGSLGVQYVFQFANGGTLTPRIDGFHQSKICYRVNSPSGGYYSTQNSLNCEPGRETFNARLTYAAPDDAWSVALSVTNLTDEFYYQNRFEILSAGFGSVQGYPARPREWAITLRKNFN